MLYSALSFCSILNTQALIAVVAEWLRRLTRNQIPSGSVGSNPTGCVHKNFFYNFFFFFFSNKLMVFSALLRYYKC